MVFWDTNIGSEFIIYDRDFLQWLFLLLSAIFVFIGLTFTNKRILIIVGSFLWLEGIALVKITLSYDELLCLHDNYIIYRDNERLSMLNAWGNSCTDFKFDSYQRCYTDGNLEEPANFSFIFLDNGNFYGFSHGNFFPAGQIRYRDGDPFSRINLVSFINEELDYKDVFAYIVVDRREIQPIYRFFNSWGVYIGSSPFFIISDYDQSSDFVLQLNNYVNNNLWDYYKVFIPETMGAKLIRTTFRHCDKIYLSNVYPSNGNELYLVSPIPLDTFSSNNASNDKKSIDQ